MNGRLAGPSLPRPPGRKDRIPHGEVRSQEGQCAGQEVCAVDRRRQGTGQGGRDQGRARTRHQEGSGGQGRTPKPPAKKAASKAAPAKAAPAKTAPDKVGAEQGGAGQGTSQGRADEGGAEQGRQRQVRGRQGGAGQGRASKTGTEAAPKPKPVNPFDAKFLDGQRSLLLEERAKLVGQADHLEAEAAQLMEDLDPGDVQFDDESGEGDSLVVERERDLALSGQARQTVAEIDAALRRIDEGTYGLSVVSGRPIPKERLRAHPVGDRAGRGEGRRPRHPPLSSRVSDDRSPEARSPGRGQLGVAIAVAVLVVAARSAHQVVGAGAAGDGDIDVVWTLRFHLTFNSGMAFSQGRGLGPVIGALGLVVVVVLLVSARKGTSKLGAVAVGMVVGGAVGNLLDRLFRSGDGFLQGRVVDFIDFQWWPVFNVADMAVVIGGILLVVSAWSGTRQPAQ